jgi:serine/threonine protein kinase
MAKTASVYTATEKLGQGAYGLVRKFQNADGEQICVKSLITCLVGLSPSARGYQSKKVQREAMFNIQAYPNERLSAIFEFDSEQDGYSTYTNRYVMPYARGEVAWRLIKRITCPYQLAEVMLQIVQELQRIHDRGILHGDPSFANIMIESCENKKYKVRFIDFGRSYSMRDNSAPLYYPDKLTTKVPPELCKKDDIEVKPHPNQDVYILGRWLNSELLGHPSYQVLESLLLPSIRSFISKAQSIEPLERPALATFSEQLTSDLNTRTEIDALSKKTTQAENRVEKVDSALMSHGLWANPPQTTPLATEVHPRCGPLSGV